MSLILAEFKNIMEQTQQVGSDDDIKNWIKKSKTIESVTKIPGDASTRRYYRVQANSKSYIVMKMESFSEQGEALPFLAVQKHLLQSGVEVPEVLDVDPGQGFILLEDLGDTTLLRKLQGVDNADHERHLYERIIDSLVQLQVNASPNKSGKSLDAFKLRFDHEKLMWEVNFTIENFYELYLKRKLNKDAYQLIRENFSEICTILDQQPTVLTHRDFHSRNVMVMPGETGADRFVMIDFQDARMGPIQYDLSSLLKDSYYQLEEFQTTRLLDYYIARYEALAGQSIDRNNFLYIFDLMAIQRNFKAIGSFASFMNRRADPTYLKYIGNTFENIRRTLLKYPKFSPLREILFHYYYF